jgi:hypothetical protein
MKTMNPKLGDTTSIRTNMYIGEQLMVFRITFFYSSELSHYTVQDLSVAIHPFVDMTTGILLISP